MKDAKNGIYELSKRLKGLLINFNAKMLGVTQIFYNFIFSFVPAVYPGVGVICVVILHLGIKLMVWGRAK